MGGIISHGKIEPGDYLEFDSDGQVQAREVSIKEQYYFLHAKDRGRRIEEGEIVEVVIPTVQNRK